MAGQEDWEQISVNGVVFWGHKPCGQVIMQNGTNTHEPLCPAKS